MNENENIEIKSDTPGDNAPRKSGFRLWLENFIYHYKWHSIIAFVLMIAVVVCSVQMCQKESYDVYVMYAGSHEVKKVNEGGNLSEYVTMMNSLRSVCKDHDGDGNISVSLDTLYMLSDEEITKIEKELAEQNKQNGTDYSLSYEQLTRNNTTFRDRMTYSEYYLCILSEDIFNTYKSVDGFMRFMPLEKYVEDGVTVEYVEGSEGTAVYLKSTGFSSLPAFSALPENTVIALRVRSEISAHFTSEENKELYRRSEDMLRAILNYK